MSDLELFAGTGDTLAERMRAAVEAEGLLALVGDAKKHVRRALADAVTETSKQTGTSFTAKHEGWAAQFTDPQPKPHVADADAFHEWVLKNNALPWEEHERVEVISPTLAVQVVKAAREGRVEDAETISRAFHVDKAFLLPEKPLDQLVKSGRIKVTDTAVVDLETGEPVPGTTVTRKDPELRLTPKGKTERDAAKRDVAEKLGVNLRALEAGGDS